MPRMKQPRRSLKRLAAHTFSCLPLHETSVRRALLEIDPRCSQTCYWWVGPDKAWDGVVARPGKDPARLVLLLGGAEAQPRPYDGTLPDRHPDCLR